jgi:Tfp pilus assembly protein PilW
VIRVIRGRAVRDGDSGLGLIELLAATFISLLMLTLVGGMFVQITKLTANGQSTKNALGVAWIAMNELAGVTRQATEVATSTTKVEGGVIAGSTPTTLILDTYDRASVVVGQAAVVPSRVTFSVDPAGKLMEQRVLGVLTGGYYAFTGAGTSSAIVGPILTTATGTDALFVYYTGSGDSLAALTPGSAGLTSAEAAQVTTVGITVTVANSTSAGSDPVRLANQITMPNVAISNGGN